LSAKVRAFIIKIQAVIWRVKFFLLINAVIDVFYNFFPTHMNILIIKRYKTRRKRKKNGFWKMASKDANFFSFKSFCN